MATWKEPTTTYTVEDQVTPDIFNTLAENEIYLNETKITTNQVQEATVLSEVSETRENLTEADTIMGAFSKIRKWFEDLKALAFKDTVATDDIDNAAVTNGKIADGAVTSGKLGTSSVLTAKINALAVTTAKLAASAVTTAKIADLNVTTAKLAAGAVTTDKLGDLAVTYAKLGVGACSGDRIADSAITTAKLATGAVTDAKVTDVAASKITGLATVATSGSYNDLSNKPTISTFTMTRGTYKVNYQYNIPATGIYLCFVKFTNSAGFTQVACLGTMSNSPNVDNDTYSGISSLYVGGDVLQVQLRCSAVSSTAIKYGLYISTSETTTPSVEFEEDGTVEVIMYKISTFAAIS